jgi:hypothetical protein
VEGMPNQSSRHPRMRHPSCSCLHHHPDDTRVDVPDADSSSAGNRADPSSHAASAVATSTPTASAHASATQGQACGVHERSSSVFAHFVEPMDVEEWLCTIERELHTTQCNNREKVLYGPRLLREQHSPGGSLTSPPMPTLKPSPGRNSGKISAIIMF